MKYTKPYSRILCRVVTPFTGVWIEIRGGQEEYPASMVTPFTGVWIEIFGLE